MENMGIERMMKKRAPALNLKPTFDSCTIRKKNKQFTILTATLVLFATF